MSTNDDLKLAELARFSRLFGALDEAGRKKLMSLSSKRSYAAGDVICREGDDGTEFFVVTKGDVSVDGDDFGDKKAIATLSTGQFFGEVALLSGQKRQATVTATSAVEVVAFPRQAVQEVLAQAPQARALLQKVGLLRTEDTMKKMMG